MESKDPHTPNIISNKYKSSTLGIGEYQVVFKKSNQKHYLILAHTTPCTIEEALRIIAWISKEYYKDMYFIITDWTIPQGMGGICNIPGGDKGEKRPFVSLPTEPMIHPRRWVRKLRIGIVLHELAHAISVYSRKGGNNHGKIFMNTFDELLKLYYKRIEKDIFISVKI